VSATAFQSCPLTRETLWASPVTVQMNNVQPNQSSSQIDYDMTIIGLLRRFNRLYC
jgi:hypothetical protein